MHLALKTPYMRALKSTNVRSKEEVKRPLYKDDERSGADIRSLGTCYLYPRFVFPEMTCMPKTAANDPEIQSRAALMN